MDKISNLKNIIINTLDSNKALDIISIDLKNKSSMADYMIIASGTSSRHIQSLSEQVLDKLIDNGILPILIEWNKEQHPSKKLSNSKVTLKKLCLYHPEPKKINNIISNLIESDLISISVGEAKVEVILDSPSGKVKID